MAKFTIKENAESRYLLNIITIQYCSSDKRLSEIKIPHPEVDQGKSRRIIQLIVTR
jgi:hypothetical protein